MRIQDYPPDLPESGADSIYSYENLPSKHQKKYVYASRFVQLARAKTPKITYYSTKAKCDLMENMENFEVSFYDGQKIVRTSENNVRIFDSTGSMIAMNGEHDSVQTLWQHYQQSFEHCRSLERALSNIHSDGKECFPIIVGRNQAKASNSTDSRNNTNNILSPRLAGVSETKQNQFLIEINKNLLQLQASTLMSLNSVTSTRVSQAKSSPVFHASSEKVIVPGIGVACRLPGGVVEVCYPDGSRLAVGLSGHGGGITFTQTNGSQCHYTNRDDPPQLVRTKLEQMPNVLKCLMENSNPTVPLCTPVSNRCMQPQKFFR